MMSENTLDMKYYKLIDYLRSLNSVVVAFSGGVDSTFLLKAVQEALGENAVALTIVSPYIPKWEIDEAKEIASKLNIKHIIVEVPIIDEIRLNPSERCYLCKKSIFTMIKNFAVQNNYNYVLDGTNFDDTKDYRPGLRALRELNIRSPLLENEFTKSDIRTLSHMLSLPTWDKPAYACLLSRIPYNTEIDEKELVKIEKSEKYLMDKGIRAVRVRCHGDVARIEVNAIEKIKFFDENFMEEAVKNIKQFGFKYVCLDLEGYRMGSLNEGLTN